MNPFKFGTIVDGDYFTDRVEETALLKQKLDSENHIVLISPRRYGKSSLVQRVLADSDRPQIRLDMQYVVSVSDFASQLLKALFRIYPMERIRHSMTHFRIAPTVSVNAVTGALEVNFQPAANNVVLLEDAMALLEKVAVRGISHITGGGFYENIPRSIPDGLGAKIRKSDVRILPIFQLIAEKGGITERDMFNTFNMGVGMSIVVPAAQKEEALKILKDQGVDAYEIGEIVKSENKIEIV